MSQSVRRSIFLGNTADKCRWLDLRLGGIQPGSVNTPPAVECRVVESKHRATADSNLRKVGINL